MGTTCTSFLTLIHDTLKSNWVFAKTSFWNGSQFFCATTTKKTKSEGTLIPLEQPHSGVVWPWMGTHWPWVGGGSPTLNAEIIFQILCYSFEGTLWKMFIYFLLPGCYMSRLPVKCFVLAMTWTSRRPTTPWSVTTAAGRRASSVWRTQPRPRPSQKVHNNPVGAKWTLLMASWSPL